MTNRIALGLGILIVLGIAGDVLLNDAAASLFTARRANDLVEWLAFWR